MTKPTWRDFSTHLMHQGTARNDYFHATEKCPRVKNPEMAVDRHERYVAYHEPVPCAVCHPEMPVPEKAEQLVIVPGDRVDAHYHCDEQCNAVQQMTDPRRLLRRETDAEPCSYCATPADNSDDIRVCPECDSPAVRRLVNTDGWTCRAKGCGATFDEPVERGNRGGNDGPATGLARQLLEADPEDVSAENAGGRSA